jgi:ubiquinone/menaquinone biosynthesis C-methylase UbiE
MTWEETIQSIRNTKGYEDLVKLSYFDQDLHLNVKRFGESEEFRETLNVLEEYAGGATSILDIGAGNGISSVNFALKGYTVTAVEPDASYTVGANAIRQLKYFFHLNHLDVYECIGEEMVFDSDTFDVVYIRQAMHHARSLKRFLGECARVLKKNGVLFTVRDHVIFDEKDKETFLQSHPLHKFYGGENAFTPREYREAMESAGLKVIKEIKYYDSQINYFPSTTDQIRKMEKDAENEFKKAFKSKASFLSGFPFIFQLYKLKNRCNGRYLKEELVPGRMYSYIAQKL